MENRLFIVTKDETRGLYRSVSRLESAGDVTLERIGELGLAVVTGARGADTPRARVPLDSLGEPQGEGVALDADGTLYLASEGRSWTRGGSLVVLRCARPQ